MLLKHFFTTALALCMAATVHAQQNVGFKTSQVKSPIVNADKTVTFSLVAPQAKAVTVNGDWEANKGKGEMKKARMAYGPTPHPHCPLRCIPTVLISMA